MRRHPRWTSHFSLWCKNRDTAKLGTSIVLSSFLVHLGFIGTGSVWLLAAASVSKLTDLWSLSESCFITFKTGLKSRHWLCRLSVSQHGQRRMVWILFFQTRSAKAPVPFCQWGPHHPIWVQHLPHSISLHRICLLHSALSARLGLCQCHLPLSHAWHIVGPQYIFVNWMFE